MTDTLSDAREIVVEEVFPHEPETVWKALTTPALIGRWLRMEPHGLTPEVGRRFTFRTSPAGEWDGTIACEVLDVVPGERFAFSWRGGHAGNEGYGSLLDTVVAFTLERAPGGTRLRLVHSGFVLPRNDSSFRNMSAGWSQVVPRIGEVAGE